MEVFETLNILSEQMDLEPAEGMPCPRLSMEPTNPPKYQAAGVIFQPAVPTGPKISLMKSLLTSACERNCFYCPFRSGRDFRRATLKPEEMAQAFMAYQRSGIAEGLFLSSGIAGGGLTTQDKLIATAELLRNKHHFKGYLHLKIMPGVEQAQVERAMQLADRVSINLEAPNTHRLQALAPRKEFIQELLQPLQWVEEIRQSLPGNYGWQGRWPSSATQFVVGAAGESDTELLRLTEYLHNALRLKRVLFFGFPPSPGYPSRESICRITTAPAAFIPGGILDTRLWLQPERYTPGLNRKPAERCRPKICLGGTTSARVPFGNQQSQFPGAHPHPGNWSCHSTINY